MNATDTLAERDTGKRVVTTDGTVLGRIARVEGEAAYVLPRRGTSRGCDSWIAPSWDEREPVRLDERAVVGVGDTAVVVEPRGATQEGPTEGDEADGTGSSREERSTDLPGTG